MFYVYVLRSLKDGKRYIGQTKNLKNRLQQHMWRMTQSTKGRGEFELIYFEKFKNRNEVVMREKYLKSGIGREYLDKVIPR